MLDRHRFFIIISIIIAIGIVFFIWFLLFRNPSPEANVTPPDGIQGTETSTGTGSSNESEGGTSTVAEPAMPPEDNYVRQLARIFVERFGSFSNQNDNSHIAAVLPLVTAGMERWIETQGIPQQGAYEGMTTKVVVATIDQIAASSASVHVEVQELVETLDSKETQYRTGTVTLVLQNGEWKVDGLFWD